MILLLLGFAAVNLFAIAAIIVGARFEEVEKKREEKRDAD